MAGAQGLAEKQGYLGNLEKRPRSELQDLLNRQQKLLENKQFISKLADKGARIRTLVERLRAILDTHKVVDSTADMLQKMALDADSQHRERTKFGCSSSSDEDLIKQIINKDTEKQIEDERNELAMEEKDEISKETEPKTFINSYEKVIRNVEQKQLQNGPENTARFKPHKTLKTTNIYNVPPDRLVQLKKSNTSSSSGTKQSDVSDCALPTEQTAGGQGELMDTESSNKQSSEDNVNKSNKSSFQRKTLAHQPVVAGRENSRRKYRYDDSLEMDMTRGPLNHEPTKLISVEESVEALEKQQQIYKELQATQAAERLAQRLHFKVGDFNPEGAASFATTYRDTAVESDTDNSEAEEDYPD